MASDTSGDAMPGRPLWTPPQRRVEASAMQAFLRGASGVAGGDLVDTSDLHRWSTTEPDAFWGHLAAVLLPSVDWSGPVRSRGAEPGGTAWFPEVRLNAAERILAGDAGTGTARPGGEAFLVAVDERGRRRVVTRAQATAAVAEVAAALRAAGVGPGDRVAAWMPNTVETVLAMLGAAAVGAVFSSTSPDFGAEGVLDRFGQIEPTVLIAADGYTYGGTPHDRGPQLAEIASRLPHRPLVVIVPFLSDSPDVSGVPGAVPWDVWLAPHEGAQPTYEPVPFDHPWYVLYSSGTTGAPKCIVHRAGGVLLQHVKEQRLHLDVRPGDAVSYFTTAGWMMWNWLASVPASGATAVLYEGNPFHPGPQRLWDLAADEGLSFLGVSAKYIDAVAATGLRPCEVADLSGLRTLASTGSPLSPAGFGWVMESVAPGVGPDGLHLASISGGTDLCGCFVLGDPTRPVWSGEIQTPALGMAVDVWGDDGTPVGPGVRGELVCTEPFPSMPLGFWGDGPLGQVGPRYRAAYFERFPGVWAHGDFASWTAHGGMVIHGRSDTTLNPGGVRIGTAEIYRQVDGIDGVVESLVFGREVDDDVRVVLLVRLADGTELDDELTAGIRRRIREGCTPRHVPAEIVAVDDLPRTRSGKLAELAVVDAVNGRPIRNTTALANPEVLAHIRTAVVGDDRS
jgi:acetoacetyl-CoA synthetase